MRDAAMQRPILTVRLLDNGHYRIQWNGSLQNARLFVSATPYDPAPTPLGRLDGPEHTVPFAGVRAYFAVIAGNAAPVWAASRSVEIRNVANFRDLGGYSTLDGRSVRWGRFFRSSALHGMSQEEQRVWTGMRIAQVFDFRGEQERIALPDCLPDPAVYRCTPAFTGQGEAARLVSMDMADQLRTIHTRADADPVRAMFRAVYTELAFSSAAYRRVLAALDAEHDLPIVFHCTAGKDRTGVCCALILLALGAPREVIMEDYLLSAPYREESNRRLLAHFAKEGMSDAALELAAEMVTVRPAMLGEALDAIDARYPNLECYFTAEYGADAARLAHWRDLHTI